MEWEQFEAVLNTPEALGATIQGIAVLMASIIALMAVILGVRETHKRNYREWAWDQIYELLNDITKLHLKAHRNLSNFKNYLDENKTYPDHMYENEIKAIMNEAIVVVRKAYIITSNEIFKKTLVTYMEQIRAVQTRLFEYNYYVTQEKPDQNKQKHHSEAVALALEIMLNGYNKTMELVYSNLRFTISKRKSNTFAQPPLHTRLKRRLLNQSIK